MNLPANSIDLFAGMALDRFLVFLVICVYFLFIVHISGQQSDDRILAHITRFHHVSVYALHSKRVEQPKEVKTKHTLFGSSASSSSVVPEVTVLGGEKSDRKTKTTNFPQRTTGETQPEGEVHPLGIFEPVVNLSATEHITPLYNSSFSSCPFAGVFPSYKNDYLLRPTKEEITTLQSNRFRSPSRVDVADMRSRYHSNQYAFDLPFDATPRSYFYTLSNASATHTIPVMMDAFSYCEDGALVMETIFNVNYMFGPGGRDRTQQALRDVWTATIDGNFTVENQMAPDNHKHTILLVFTFADRCTSRSTTYFIHSEKTNFNYTVTPSFLPTFSQRRFYLIACTSIDHSPVDQVKAWINYHFYQGVEHFTFYLNAEVQRWKTELAKYIRHGLVNVVEYTYPRHRKYYEQPSALQSCNRRYRLVSDFILFSDVDEFMIPSNPEWRVVDVLNMYDSLFPDTPCFRVYNTFYGCGNYTPSMWSKTNNLYEICPNRWVGYIRDMRWKQFIRPCVTPFAQVHHVSYANSRFMNPQMDMIMYHFKIGMVRKPTTSYTLNQYVVEGMRDPL